MVLDLVPLWTALLALAVFYYVVFDGFDLGVGILYGFVCFGFVLMTWRALEVAWNNWNRGYSVLEKPELADEMK